MLSQKPSFLPKKKKRWKVDFLVLKEKLVNFMMMENKYFLTLQKNYSKEFNPPDIKYGRGGFQELELLVQMGMLLMNLGYKKNHQSPKKLIVLLFRASFLNEDEFKEISLIYDLFFNYQQVICIMSDKIDNKEILSNHGLQYLFENFLFSGYGRSTIIKPSTPDILQLFKKLFSPF